MRTITSNEMASVKAGDKRTDHNTCLAIASAGLFTGAGTAVAITMGFLTGGVTIAIWGLGMLYSVYSLADC